MATGSSPVSLTANYKGINMIIIVIGIVGFILAIGGGIFLFKVIKYWNARRRLASSEIEGDVLDLDKTIVERELAQQKEKQTLDKLKAKLDKGNM